MKKHYEKLCMTPLGIEFESNVLVIQGSIVDNAETIVAIDQEVGTYDFEGDEFSVDWD